MDTKQIIFELDLGTFNKSGRLLNLEETHSIICQKNHKVTHSHDPRTDVRLTKCIFDYVIRKQGFDRLTEFTFESFPLYIDCLPHNYKPVLGKLNLEVLNVECQKNKR